jgi:hypothetical protein
MSYLSFSDEGVTEVADDGTVSRPTPVPFEQWSFLGGWKPICIKHKLLFQRRQSYYDHYTTLCNDYKTSECPPSDLAIQLKGYRRVWL